MLELGYGGILMQVQNYKEQILQFTSPHWNDYQKHYSTTKKKRFFPLCYALQNFKVIY